MKAYLDMMPISGCKITGEHPLPIFRDIEKDKPSRGDGTLSKAEEYRLGDNTGFRVLPYRMQDKYNRDKSTIMLHTAVLENDKLVATFLPQQGGRLVSLKNKQTGKEILYKNPVFQPANLGIRNAWFSGGVEWNCAQYGHTVYSSSPVFFAKVKAEDGEEFLRMYEFERMKRLYVQLDFHLPDGSEQLFVNINVYNQDDSPQSMYWWSNIAIQASKKLRVFSGTEEAIYLDPNSISDNTNPIRVFGKTRLPYLPTLPGLDSTYPNNANYANEFFFQNPEDPAACWSAAAYEDGRIFFEASTLPLRFRKMFCWGSHQGGQRWCAYLATPEEGDYVEMQAGLAPTQLNSIDIPAKTRWCYTQAIGETWAGDANAPYNEDYPAARGFVEGLVHGAMPVETLSKKHDEYAAKAELPLCEILSQGTGWGALEQLRAEKAGEAGAPRGLCFPLATIDEEVYPWYQLLEKGIVPKTEPRNVPPSWMVDEKFRALLEGSLAKEGGEHYLSKLLLGVMLYELGEREQGAALFAESAAMEPNPIALRNLSYDAKLKGEMDTALSYMEKAVKLENCEVDKVFSEEYMDLLLGQKKFSEAWAFYNGLPAEYKNTDRLSVQAGLAAVELDEFDFVNALLKRDIACVREGDTSLTDIFFRAEVRKRLSDPANTMSEAEATAYVQKNVTPPSHIDFRMFVGGGEDA